MAFEFKNIITGNIIINVKGCSLNFFPRFKWTTANAKITFEKVLVSVGRGELNAGTGIFKCGQAGEQLSLSFDFDNSYSDMVAFEALRFYEHNVNAA